MVDTLSAFADEVTRVAREVGTEGLLGGQARVPNVAGTWKDLTDNVNSMANNLTDQVRNIAQVTTAVANGDLTRKIDVDARGEILELKTTINTMVDQLSVVRRRGHPGRPRGRQRGPARRPGRGRGRLRHLEAADRERQRAGRQPHPPGPRHRRGDQRGRRGRPDPLDHRRRAQGEVAELKDNINSMVESLRETTRANQEQDWLKSNLARISGLMQGHRDLAVVAELIMDELTPLVVGPATAPSSSPRTTDGGTELRLIGGYGRRRPDRPARFALGESLVGQAAREPAGPSPSTTSRPTTSPSPPGSAQPPRLSLIVLPIVFEDQVLGVIELASCHAVHRGAPRLPRPAHGDHRRQRQHHRRQRPHRRAARASRSGSPPSCRPARRSCRPAGGAAALQRRAGGQGGAAGHAEPRHRDQEPRDRAGPAGAGGPRPAARAGLQVQVASSWPT